MPEHEVTKHFHHWDKARCRGKGTNLREGEEMGEPTEEGPGKRTTLGQGPMPTADPEGPAACTASMVAILFLFCDGRPVNSGNHKCKRCLVRGVVGGSTLLYVFTTADTERR